MKRFVASTLALLVLCQCESTPVVRRPPAEEEVTEYYDRRHNLTVSYPARWVRAEEQLTILGNPNEILALATFPLKGGNGCAPKKALEDARSDDAIIFLTESTATAGKKPRIRPSTFAAVPKPEIDECWGVRVSTYRFRDAGGRFQADVWFGPDATRRTRDDAIAILDSLRFGTREHSGSFFERARRVISQRKLGELRRASKHEHGAAAPKRELAVRVRRRLAREAPGARLIEMTLGIFVSTNERLGGYRKLTYVVHTGPFSTGDCLDFYDAKTLEYELGSCFITDREL